MTDDNLLERAAEAAHDAWMAAKVAQGFHAPEHCPGSTDDAGHVDVSGRLLACRRCHKDIRPYADLDEPTKELDRAHVRAVHGVYAERLAALEAERAAARRELADAEPAAVHMALDAMIHDGSTLADGLRQWAQVVASLAEPQWANGAHSGDCTSVAQTCNRCVVEDYRRRAASESGYPARRSRAEACVAAARKRHEEIETECENYSPCEATDAAADMLAAVERATGEVGGEEPKR